MSRETTRYGSRVAGLITLAVLMAATVFTATAQADTIFPPGTGPFTVTATVNGTTYSYPGGGPGPTIPNVNDGDNVTISIADAAGGPDVNFARLRARQCAQTREVSNNIEFSPEVTNRCSSTTLGSGSTNAFVDSGPVAPGTTAMTVNFKVGAGTAPDVEDPIFGENLPGFSCGTTAACKIVVNAEVSSGTGSSNYVSFPLTFFVAPSTETVLMECDNLGGTGTVKAPLNNTIQPNVAISLKSATDTIVPGLYPKPCTGVYAASAGPLTKWAGKVTGNLSCSTSATGPAAPYLPNGKFTYTWTTLDARLKPLTSQAYVRLNQTADMVDDVSVQTGLVIKGVAVGADVQGSFLLQPTLKNGPLSQSALLADGSLTPGTGSQTLASSCATGVGSIASVLTSTDGAKLDGTPFDSSIKFTLPA